MTPDSALSFMRRVSLTQWLLFSILLAMLLTCAGLVGINYHLSRIESALTGISGTLDVNIIGQP